MFSLGCMRYVLGLVCIMALAQSAAADPDGDLFRAHYDIAIADYCGLVSQAVAIGYVLLHHDLLARGNIRPEDDRAAQLKAVRDADYAYQDWGLSGHKKWCRQEGEAAVARLTLYFQRRGLP